MHTIGRCARFALPCSPLNCRRQLSSLTSQNLSELDEWIASPKHTVLQDSLHPERVADLYITLPTRNGVTKPFRYPRLSRSLGYGHHMAFFHPLAPENQLRPDGTEGDFCPPEPFTRRMWAGGKIVWNPKDPLRVGEKATATWSVDSVEKKGFEKGNPMLFVNKKIEYTMIGKAHPSVVEERSHVYLSRPQAKSGPREGMC
jgi:hydroxyacyl-ACP dehydratase HTD2-like protein with hotdog domain